MYVFLTQLNIFGFSWKTFCILATWRLDRWVQGIVTACNDLWVLYLPKLLCHICYAIMMMFEVFMDTESIHFAEPVLSKLDDKHKQC